MTENIGYIDHGGCRVRTQSAILAFTNWPINMSVAFAMCRFVAGLGIGGEYPLAAAIAKEAMAKNLCLSRRSLLITNMFAMSFGILGCFDLFSNGQPWLTINNPLCCAKTFPDFFERLRIARLESHG